MLERLELPMDLCSLLALVFLSWYPVLGMLVHMSRVGPSYICYCLLHFDPLEIVMKCILSLPQKTAKSAKDLLLAALASLLTGPSRVGM